MPTKSVANEDILELLQESMQMTSEGLGKLDRRIDETNERMDGLHTEMNSVRHDTSDLKKSIYRLEIESSKHQEQLTTVQNEIVAIHVDTKEILDELAAVQTQLLSGGKPANLETTLRSIVHQVQTIAKKEGISL
ncbi:MAG TPA: hypothetical protein VK694_04650 [Verrucomicrobiae bacterium]|nr:hypothetical protein [Verrucomicrobiae bacterium]